jgi:hypothetical protein
LNRKTVPWIFGLVLIIIWLSSSSDFHVSAQAEYIGPDACMTCHQDKYDQWKDSKHSEAYSDPDFQQEWDSLGNQEECLQCHTSGYNQDTGTYAAEEVICEVCHGEALTMEIDSSPELCGSCHTGEYGEKRYEDFVTGTHYDSGVTCTDCHAYEGNHKFEIQSLACATCHTENEIHSSSLIPDNQAKALAAEDRAIQLEANVTMLQSELTDVENRTVFVTQLTFFGGGALFLVVIIVALAYLRAKQAYS